MKKLLYSLIIMIAAICACQDENSELGQSLVNSSFYNVYVDTCTRWTSVPFLWTP